MLTRLSGGYFAADNPERGLVALDRQHRAAGLALEAANTSVVMEMANLMTAMRTSPKPTRGWRKSIDDRNCQGHR